MDCPDRQHDACANITFVGKTKDGTPITSIVRACAALEGQNVGCTTTKADLGNTIDPSVNLILQGEQNPLTASKIEDDILVIKLMTVIFRDFVSNDGHFHMTFQQI